MMLTELKVGEKAKILNYTAGRKATQRLMDLGILSGHAVMMINNAEHTPILVSVKGTEIAIGRGIASKVQVEKIETI